jgi:hypothetical protein
MIYAIALRCWKEQPEKRPHFHQLETEFAVHRSVLAATSDRTAPLGVFGAQAEQVSASTAGSIVAGGDQMMPPQVLLDSNGYVADSSDYNVRSAPDENSNLADGDFSGRPSLLDADGYVADAASTPTAIPRHGIAARSARKPSLYEGFEHEFARIGGSDDTETRL